MIDNTSITQQKVGDIVTWNYHAAGIFREYGIDFCCGGGITLQKACEKKNLPLDDITRKLQNLNESVDNTGDNYMDWSPSFLIDYIENTHHRFVRAKTNEIAAYANKVAQVHGERHPENVTIFHAFVGLAHELLDHLEAEEQSVFPLIKRIHALKKDGLPIDSELLDKLKAELDSMESDHEQAGEAMAGIRESSNNFTPPPEACTTYRILYQNLAGFEENLHKHVHLENNILFRKAQAMIS